MIDVSQILKIFHAKMVPIVRTRLGNPSSPRAVESTTSLPHFRKGARLADSPLHQEHPRHQTMRDEYADARAIVLAKQSPETLVESTDAVVSIGSGFAIGDPVEEMSIFGPFMPHPLHLRRGRLKVAEVLLAQTWLFVDLDGVSCKGGG